MLVELWPSVDGEKAQAYFAIELSPEAMDFLIPSEGSVFTRSASIASQDGTFRHRIKSPLMLLTICEAKGRKEMPELKQIANLLRGNIHKMSWELRIPTEGWAIGA